MNTLRHILIILSVALTLPTAAYAISLTCSPAGTDVKMMKDEVKSWTATAAGCNTAATYTMEKQPMHGSMTMHANFVSNGQFTFTNSSNMHGMMGSAKEQIVVGASCDGQSTTTTINLSTSTSSCGGSAAGMVILDNTATSDKATIKSNLAFLAGCSKTSSTISTGYGGNAINIENFHLLNRDQTIDPNKLMLSIGAKEGEIVDQQYGTAEQLNYFASGSHLFELERLRSTADWLSGTDINGDANVTPKGTVAAGAYGTMTMKQFIQHVADGHTLYGITRVKIGLQRGQRSACKADCTKNALGSTTQADGTAIQASDLYGFCNATATSGLCSSTSCAPGKDFTNLKGGTTVCGIALPGDAKIKAKGSLFLDFVDYASGDTIPLSALPFAPRELYLMVNMPIMVNWAFDQNLSGMPDGTMDNMDKIRTVTASKTTSGEISASGISFTDIPQQSRDAFAYQTGSALTSTNFAALSEADKYHLLMPSGYASAWADVFDQLNITATTWRTLPPTGCIDSSGSACSKFGAPNDVTGIMTTDNVRSNKFEDIPTYLYSGGLIDMHSHVNISGLVYVPQAMELEALNNKLPNQTGISTKQYISGSVVVRDGFYIQANSSENSVTVLSADPTSYSTTKTIARTAESGFTGETSGPGDPTLTNGGDNGGDTGGSATSPCIDCLPSGGDGGGGGGTPGSRLWMEVRPQ